MFAIMGEIGNSLAAGADTTFVVTKAVSGFFDSRTLIICSSS